MLQSKLVFSHLREDCTDIQVDVTGIADLQALVHWLISGVKVVVLYLKGFLQVVESASELFRSTEDAGEIVVSYSPEPVAFISQSLCFSQKFQCNIEVF